MGYSEELEDFVATAGVPLLMTSYRFVFGRRC